MVAFETMHTIRNKKSENEFLMALKMDMSEVYEIVNGVPSADDGDFRIS